MDTPDLTTKKLFKSIKSNYQPSLPSLTVIIPVYNGEKTLPLLIKRLENVLPQLSDRFEAILINDGSKDQSWRVIRDLAEDNVWINAIDLMRNYGQHNALLCGIREARNEIILTMDDDLQHPPEEIHRLLDKLYEGYDVVYGTPHNEQHGFWRDIASQASKLALQSIMGAETARKVCAFRAFRTRLRSAFADYCGPFVSIDVLLTWGTMKFTATPVRHEARPKGKSNYTFFKLMTHALNMLTGFSTLPLQTASLIGFAFTVFGVGVLVYVIGRYLIQGTSVPGFPFLASIIAIFSGVQMFAVGIIGEYLARIHFRTMGKPPYIVQTGIKNRT